LLIHQTILTIQNAIITDWENFPPEKKTKLPIELLNILLTKQNHGISNSIINLILSIITKIIKRSWFDFPSDEFRRQFVAQIIIGNLKGVTIPNISYIQIITASLTYQLICEFAYLKSFQSPLFEVKSFVSFQVHFHSLNHTKKKINFNNTSTKTHV
jgi:hypothetical protein